MESKPKHCLVMDLPEERDGCARQTQLSALHAAVRDLAPPSAMLLPLGNEGTAVAVLLEDAVSAVSCALDAALQCKIELRPRFAVWSDAPRHEAESADPCRAGSAAVQSAHRLLEVADPGHILVSAHTVRLLKECAAWSTWRRAHLFDLGFFVTPEGAQLHLYSLSNTVVGLKDAPSGLKRPGEAGAEGIASPAQRQDAPPVSTARVLLLHAGQALVDRHVLKVLGEQLEAEGHAVTLNLQMDPRMVTSGRWAQEMESELRRSQLVIPLLSAASVDSELLEWEISVADHALRQCGTPRILPVRVSFEGALPSTLAGLLDGRQQVAWNGQEDYPMVLDAVHAALQAPEPQPLVVPVERPQLESVGGAVPIGSPFYVVRPSDQLFSQAILRHESIVLIKGARQMGKTSLLARGLHEARQNGARVVLTDFQKLGSEQLKSPEVLFLTLAEMIADQLDLDVFPEDVWDSRRGPNRNLERFLRRQVFARDPQPLVWAMDEVDRLFGCPFAAEVFGLFRSWHNERALDPEGPWSNLTMAISYATEAYLFIADMNQSPFNVGLKLGLTDFTLEHVGELNGRYGHPLRSQEEIGWFYSYLEGQPYLTRRGLHEMASTGSSVELLKTRANCDEGIFGDHLRRMLAVLSQTPALSDAVRQMLHCKEAPDLAAFYNLRAAGLVAGDSASEARIRCPLYAEYLARHLR